jgi:RNA polymerase sporulation-specific sigma factor
MLELTDRQQLILKLSFGLDGLEPNTENEIAVKLKISQSGASQLKSRALKALRKKIVK